ncbi:MAG: DUF4129 domain-containing protein [Gemmatimonadaceae bacterium]
MPLPLVAQLPDSTIRAAVYSVFARPEFNRFTLWERLWGWIVDLWHRVLALLGGLLHSTPHSSPVFWTVVALLALALAAIIVRGGYLAYQRSRMRAEGLRWDSAGNRRGLDSWAAANELAATGNFTDAAHALYAALLEAAARQQQIRLHPSKTIGDYVRELRARSSSLLGRFREFARSYESVIYGVGHCDRDRYLRLQALAMPIVRPNG